MKKHPHILMVLSVAISLCIIPACKPQRGGVDTGTPCGGADSRLASGQGGVAKVPLNVYRGLSYGAQMTWANNKINSAAPTIHSCASVVSLEEENGELVAYVATAYHCVRNMAEQHVNGTVNEYALYFNIASDADCQTTEGKRPNYVKV
ncbi:MAG: hypothetical protein OXC44_03775, partial [Proteobacteria bacterium]|nr:hypothetical protein [Pseudomonadota bacterium]